MVVESPEAVARAVPLGLEALLRVLRPGCVLRLALEAPLWRVEAKCPEAGSRLPCSLRLTLPTAGAGADVEVAAPGALGREAMRAVSRSAYCRLVELSAEGLPLIEGMARWVQATELHELAASHCPARAGPTGRPADPICVDPRPGAGLRALPPCAKLDEEVGAGGSRSSGPQELHAALGGRLGGGGCLAT